MCFLKYNTAISKISFMVFAAVRFGLPIIIVMITNAKIVHAMCRQRNIIHASNGNQKQLARIYKGSLVSIMLVLIILFTLAPEAITSSINHFLHSSVSFFACFDDGVH